MVTQGLVTRAAAHKQAVLGSPGARGSQPDQGQARGGPGDPEELLALPGPFHRDKEQLGMSEHPVLGSAQRWVGVRTLFKKPHGEDALQLRGASQRLSGACCRCVPAWAERSSPGTVPSFPS